MSEGLIFYRCRLCRGVVSKWDIKEVQGCPKCGHRRLNPSNLNLWEMFMQICKHPKVWTWEDTQPNNLERL
jgi:DNA-directed RNA polymerase subunit RPC12/RpoP